MKFFTKYELKSLFTIFLILFGLVTLNMGASLRKGRDATRKNDLSAMQKAIDIFYQKYKEFPKSTEDGKIIGCFNEEPVVDRITGIALNAVTCEWGLSTFENIKTMPRDPSYKKGSSYLYISNGKDYELYVSLEGKKEPEYTTSIIIKNLQCGIKVCNYGRWSD
ncbi:MAG TPA: hypothetical protein VI795_01785 [Patescibacteria group bacterium]|nr:hypothetical protein [Patescibacteria group bacterium]